MTKKARTSAAERQRRHRIRKRCGLVPVTVEIEAAALEALVADGTLSEADLRDRHLLAETLGYHFSDILMSRRDEW